MKHCKVWSISLLIVTSVLLILLGGMTAAIDPFFHYHAPLDGLTYPISKQRYQNYGILEHFSYDAIITGSSMTENFRASECDALFGTNSAKVCLGGGTLREFDQQLRHAIAENPDIRLIIFGLDSWLLLEDKDSMRPNETFPTYLYDDRLSNDVQYVLNKHVLLDSTLDVLAHTRKGLPTTSFDEYSFWANHATFSREAALSSYTRPAITECSPQQAGFLLENTRNTLEQNLLPLVEENPQIRFCFFFTPSSILNLDSLNRRGHIPLQFDACALACEQLLPYGNVQIFSFFNDYETITNLDNYFDTIHYSDEINSLILQRIARGEYALTPENSAAHWQEVSHYYTSYDYDILFAQKE